MYSVLDQIYGLEKTATESGDELTLNDVSAADLLAAHTAGELDINDYLSDSDDGEKTAGDEEGVDLSSFSEEELHAALSELDGNEKIASEEGAYWDTAGRQMAQGYADELTKQASLENTMDLNELSADEIIGLAYELSDEMNKTASEYEDDEIDLNAMTPEEIIELAYHLENGADDDTEKVAGIDLNDLSVDEFMGFAAELEGELEFEKEAGAKRKAMAMLGRGERQLGRFFSSQKGRNRAYTGGVKRNEKGRYQAARKQGIKPKDMEKIERGSKADKQIRASGMTAEKEFVRRRGRRAAAGIGASGLGLGGAYGFGRK